MKSPWDCLHHHYTTLDCRPSAQLIILLYLTIHRYIFFNTDPCLDYAELINEQTLQTFRRAILQNEDILSSSPISNLLSNDFWGTPLSHSGSHKSYRPLCSLTFRLNALISGLNSHSFHLVNVGLHAFTTYLVAAFAKNILPTKASVFLATFIFAIHPIHTGKNCEFY